MPSTSSPDLAALLEAGAAGDARALAKLISLIEAHPEAERGIARLTFPRSGKAWVVGVTGAPGAGKSTLVDRLVARLRARGERVAVVAVDPTSPVSGGAVLGDRVRMQSHATDPGVFVRSMATRGQLGGLARATVGAVRVLDAAGWPWIFVETVGTGQIEIDVAQAALTTVLVVTPGWGDTVQTVKAGLLELADVFAVNKADRPDADQAVRDLELALDGTIGPWRPPVLRTSAARGEGIDELGEAIAQHRAFLGAGDRLTTRRAAQLSSEVRRLAEQAGARLMSDRCQGPRFEALLDQVVERRLDPLTAADQLVGGGEGGAAATNPIEAPQDRQ